VLHAACDVADLDGIATSIRRSNSRINPETMLLTTFWRPKPIPTPNAPARMVTFVRSTPRVASASRKPVNTRT